MRIARGWVRPTSFAPRIHDISLDVLEQDGVRGVIVDLDNTLVGYRHAAPDEEVAAWVRDATSRGMKVAVVTNNATQWARDVAEELGVPCIPDAGKPSPRGFLRGLEVLGTDKHETIVIGDQVFTDVLGAKLFGMKVILTEPIVRSEQWWMRALRFMERIALYRMPRASAQRSEDTP